jgi:hypothetical protein
MYRDTTNVEHEMYDLSVIIGATGIITKGLKKNLEAVPGKHSVDSVQKTAILGTSHIIRKVNPGGGEIFRRRPDRPWGPPSLLYNGYRVCFPGVKRPGRGVDHPPSSSASVKERVELFLYSPSGPSWPFLGRALLYHHQACERRGLPCH